VLSVLKDVELDDKLEELTDVHLSILNLFGTSYVLMSQFDESLKYFFKAYTLAKQANQMEHQAISLKNIGVVYYKLKDYRKALPFMIEGEKVSDRLQNEDYMSSMNISLCYTHLKDFPNAKIYLEKSIQICGATCNAQSMTHINYASGCLNLGLKNYEAAEGDFLKSLTYAKEASDFRMQLDNIYQLSEISISQKHLAKAEMFLETGNSIISDGTPYNMEMIKIYEQMSQLYLSMKRYEQAVRYQSRYIALRDSIYSEAMTTNLMRIESNFLEHENQEKIASQQKLIQLNAEIIARQRTLSALSVVVALLALAIIVVLFRSYRRNAAMNTLLDRKVKERTDQLEANREELMSALHERDLMFSRLSSGIGEKINTLKGLCFVAGAEVIDPVARTYVEKIGDTSIEIEDCLRTVGKWKGSNSDG
jgi:tetratricopeptide (TPR) repeat protein